MSYVPSQAVQTSEAVARRRLPQKLANHPFTVLLAHSWEWHDSEEGGEWLPAVKTAKHVPGANGVRVDDDGVIQPGPMLGNMQNIKKCTPVYPGDPLLPEEFRNYLGAIECVGGGKRYHYAWVQYRSANNGRNWYPVPNPEMNRQFQRELGKSRRLIMDREELYQHKRIVENRITRNLSLMQKGKVDKATAEANIARWRAELDRMEAAFDRQFGDGATGQVQTIGSTSEPTAPKAPRTRKKT